jgi:hypothetical protein
VPDAVQEGSIEELISWTKLKLYTRELQKGTSGIEAIIRTPQSDHLIA